MTICIANEKGGSGKSTLCLNLAVQLLNLKAGVDNARFYQWIS
ncbi:hypothetical protein Taitung35_15120 [Helicobacter pylori]